MQKLGFNVSFITVISSKDLSNFSIYKKAKFLDFKIQNIVGCADIQFSVRLESLHTYHSQFCSYEPELFPGLIYRMIKPKVVLLVFVSGKVVITGAKTRDEIYEAFNNLYPILKSFKKASTS